MKRSSLINCHFTTAPSSTSRMEEENMNLCIDSDRIKRLQDDVGKLQEGLRYYDETISKTFCDRQKSKNNISFHSLNRKLIYAQKEIDQLKYDQKKIIDTNQSKILRLLQEVQNENQRMELVYKKVNDVFRSGNQEAINNIKQAFKQDITNNRSAINLISNRIRVLQKKLLYFQIFHQNLKAF